MWIQVKGEQEIIGVLDERDDASNNEPINEIDNVQIGDAVVNGVGYKDVESISVTFKPEKIEQRSTNVTPLT